jgi:hypothetical protein
VHVVFATGRQVEVHHEVHIGDVQAPGGHVRGDEEGALARLELVQRTQALGLRHLAMQTDRAKAEVPREKEREEGVSGWPGSKGMIRP